MVCIQVLRRCLNTHALAAQLLGTLMLGLAIKVWVSRLDIEERIRR